MKGRSEETSVRFRGESVRPRKIPARVEAGDAKRDASGIRFLADEIGIDGIITNQKNFITHARKLGLLTIQRVFILDSRSEERRVGKECRHRRVPDLE